MKIVLILSLLAMFISVTGLSGQAEAKRFGMGGSFGKSFNQKKSFSKPAPKQNMNNSKAATGSRAGGMMGILGGLAMGGLLGAMFFGGGFEGINFMDILIFGGIAFAIFWFMRRAAGARRNQAEYAHAGHGSPQHTPFGQPEQNSHETFMGAETSTTAAKPTIDETHFLDAARNIFMRMQADWDAKNKDDIRAFCTPDVATRVLQDMDAAADINNKTEVAMLNAAIADSWMESDLEWVAVHFQAMLKEDTLDETGNIIETANNDVNETWIFQHTANSDDPTWYLAGIQQA